MIEINRFFSVEREVNQIVTRHKIGIQSQKQGSSLCNLPTMPKYGSTLPGMMIHGDFNVKKETFYNDFMMMQGDFNVKRNFITNKTNLFTLFISTVLMIFLYSV